MKKWYVNYETEAENDPDYDPFNDPDNWDEIDAAIEEHE